ncbi:WD40-repeat-containing domain protein [Paraphysoderma sedebokerense]|nr:WD40-repeat-containing domain protein [Paraphysoderma sedebokerense]
MAPGNVSKSHQSTSNASDRGFRIIAGSYERLLYGIDAKWEVQDNEETLVLTPQFMFPSHIGCIKSVAVSTRNSNNESKKCNWLATGGTDEIVRIYNLSTLTSQGTLHHHSGTITSLAFFDSSHLLTGSEDGKVAIVRCKDWEVLKIMKGHKSAVTGITIHPSGKLAISVSSHPHRSVICWNLLRGIKATRINLYTDPLSTIFHPHRSAPLLSITYSTHINLYNTTDIDLTNPVEVFTVAAPNKIHQSCWFVWGKKSYIVAGCEKDVVVFEVGNQKQSKLLNFTGFSNRVRDVKIFYPSDPFNEVTDQELPVPTNRPVLVTVTSDGVMSCIDILRSIFAVQSSDSNDASFDFKEFTYGQYETKVRLTCLAIEQENVFGSDGSLCEQKSEVEMAGESETGNFEGEEKMENVKRKKNDVDKVASNSKSNKKMKAGKKLN